ncbi:MAG: HAD family hydrolase [Candidatus Micrarchaeota archaeon]|nr:HAD family hydrolase [Candidatus Micrarchaeota archaeon]
MKKALFLDRDGTLIEDVGYAHKPEQLKLLPGVVDGLKLLQKHYLFFIITNQPGIGKGYYTVQDFHIFNNLLIEILKKEKIEIQRTYFCPHVEGCDCKKPSTKYVRQIVQEFDIDISSCWVLGDHPSDVLMGINAGCRTIYLLSGHGAKHFAELKEKGISPNFIAHDFYSAAQYILMDGVK